MIDRAEMLRREIHNGIDALAYELSDDEARSQEIAALLTDIVGSVLDLTRIESALR